MTTQMRTAARLAALLAAAGLFAHGIRAETPVGALRGRVTAADSGRPLAGVTLILRPAAPETGRDSRRLKTDGHGVFAASRLPAGEYEIEPHTSSYRNTPASVALAEAESALVDMRLEPGDPFLNVYIHQHAHTPGGNPRIALNGFRQGDELSMRLLKVEDTALLSGDGIGIRALLAPVPAPGKTPRALREGPLRAVRQWRHRIRQRNAEGVFYEYERLGTLPPAVYVVEARGQGSTAHGWLMVTSLALVTKSVGGRLVAYAADLETGRPAAGAEVTLFRNGAAFRRLRCDARGIAETRIGNWDDEVEAIASRDGSLAMTRFFPFGYGDADARRHRVFTYTDRPVYRPGHRVRFKGIARRLEAVNYSLPSPGRVTVRVTDDQETLHHEVETALGERGSFAGEFDLSWGARAGLYTISASLGGETHTDIFAVASYRKPEWRVDVETPRRTYVRGETVPVTVRAAYYFGSPVVEGQVRYTVYRSRRYAWWGPDEEGPDEEYEEGAGVGGEVVHEGEARTDAGGTARFHFPTASSDSWSGDHDYAIEVEVTDLSQGLAAGSGSVRVNAGAITLGARPSRYVAAPGEPISVEVAARDLEGRPAAGTAVTMKASLAGDGGEGAVLKRAALRTDAGGRAEFVFTAPEGGLVLLRAGAEDGRGNRVEAAADVWVTTADGGDFAAGYAALAVVPDRKSYRPGDTAQVLVNTDAPGSTAIVAVEAEELHEYRLVELKSRSTVVRLPIRRGYEPNVFITACFVRKKEFVQSEARIEVDAASHRLSLRVESDREEYRPGETATFRLSAADARGRPAAAELSFGLVDESVYAIREEPRRGAWEAFYPRRGNEVATHFSYPTIYLGDADKDGGSTALRKEFPDTAHWSPLVVTDAAGRAEVRVRLPDTLTSWRATVIGHTAGTAIGRAVHNIRVKRDLTLRLQAPRSFTEGDRLQITAAVHNYTAGPLEPDVELRAAGAAIRGAARQRVRLQPGEARSVAWEVSVDSRGPVVLSAAAVAGPHSDGMERTVPVLPFAREEVTHRAGALAGGETEELFRIDPRAVDAAAELRLAPSLAGPLLGALEYLATYPYGCTEQTMSSFLPNVAILNAIEGLGLRRPELRNRLPEMAQAGLLRLNGFQHEDGGWGWWEHGGSEPWMTAYVLFGMLQARQAGLRVNARIYRNGLEAARARAEAEELRPDDGAFLAYMLVLAGAKRPAAKLLARLEPLEERLQVRSRAYRLLALAELGTAEARRAGAAGMALLWSEAREAGGMAHWNERQAEDGAGAPADAESTAVAMLAALKLTPDDPRIAGAARWLMQRRRGGRWESTRDTAFILLALSEYLKKTGELGGQFRLAVRLNGREIHAAEIAGAGTAEDETVIRIPLGELASGNRLTLHKEGAGTLYYALQVTQRVPAESFAPESSVPGLSIRREYYRLETRRDASGRLAVVPERKPSTQFRVGDRVMARLEIRNSRPLEYLLLEDPLPAGWEVQERGQMSRDEWSYWWSQFEARDDRVAVCIRDLPPPKPGEAHVVEYYLRPETAGAARALPVVVSDMYLPAARASSAEARVRVSR